MKKLILNAAVVLCIVLIFSSCKSNKLFESDTDLTVDSDLEILTEWDKYSAETEKIIYTITNKKSGEISCSAEGFSLQKFENDEWKTVGFKSDIVFNELAQILKSGEKTRREIKLSEYFHLPLEKGEYRIIVDYTPSNVFVIN